MLTAVRTPAFARNDQRTHPLDASSEYTKPVSAPTNTRPPTTTGWPYAELPLGNPNAHFSASFGVSATVRPGDVWKREFPASCPQPFQPDADEGVNAAAP